MTQLVVQVALQEPLEGESWRMEPSVEPAWRRLSSRRATLTCALRQLTREREGDGQAVASTSSAAVAASSAAVAASSAVVPTEPEAPVAKRPKATAADAPMPARSEDDDMHAALAALGDASPDIREVFSPGRFTERSSAFDLRPGLAFRSKDGLELG